MSNPEVFLLKFYRNEPGDLGITDLTHSYRDDLEQRLTDALLGLHFNERISDAQRPDRARAVTADGLTVIATIEVAGANRVRRL